MGPKSQYQENDIWNCKYNLFYCCNNEDGYFAILLHDIIKVTLLMFVQIFNTECLLR